MTLGRRAQRPLPAVALFHLARQDARSSLDAMSKKRHPEKILNIHSPRTASGYRSNRPPTGHGPVSLGRAKGQGSIDRSGGLDQVLEPRELLASRIDASCQADECQPRSHDVRSAACPSPRAARFGPADRPLSAASELVK